MMGLFHVIISSDAFRCPCTMSKYNLAHPLDYWQLAMSLLLQIYNNRHTTIRGLFIPASTSMLQAFTEVGGPM